MIRPTLFILTSLLLFAESFATEISPTDPNIRYVGRFVMTDPESPRMYWSGSHIIAWFEGTSCSVKLNSNNGQDYFNIIIDDQAPQKVGLQQGSGNTITIDNLDEGIHRIEIFKRTSFLHGNTAFEGLVLDEGKNLAPLPPEPALKLQIYGDSISDGFSVDSFANTDAPVNWNNYLAYGAVAARELKMSYVCTAASGIAVVIPYPSLPGFIMHNYYDRLIPGVSGESGRWDFTGDQPDVVVVNLFQNDRWLIPEPHSTATRDNIVNTYTNLILNIRNAHQNAEIVCALGNMDASRPDLAWSGYVQTVVGNLQAEGDTKISSLIVPPIPRGGHPVASEQKLIADALVAHIQNNFHYLFTRDSDSDGVSDVKEVSTGTDPHNPQSYFRAEISSELGNTALSWPTRVGNDYRVMETSDFDDWFITQDWSPALALPQQTLDLNNSEGKRFYVIETR